MGKKKDKKQRRKYAADYGYAMPQYGAWEGAKNAGFLKNLPGFMGKRPSEQFLMGALLGAGAAWILSDEEMRGKVMKAGMKLYANMVGGFEEVKEQMADIRAEMEAEQYGAE
jgi:hypothetical protein